MPLIQKTREGCGCFRGLFRGSPGKLRKSHRKIAGKFFLRLAKCYKFQDFGHLERQTCREPWVDTAGTLSPPSVRGVFWNRQLEAPLSEPFLRTLLRTLFYGKTHSRPPAQNPQEPFLRTLPITFSDSSSLLEFFWLIATVCLTALIVASP